MRGREEVGQQVERMVACVHRSNDCEVYADGLGMLGLTVPSEPVKYGPEGKTLDQEPINAHKLF